MLQATTATFFLNCKVRSSKAIDSEFRQVLKSPAALTGSRFKDFKNEVYMYSVLVSFYID